MLKLIPISSKVQGQVEKFGLSKKFQKAVFLLQANFRHLEIILVTNHYS